MRVLQINATYGYSSTGLIMKDIGEALRREGGEPYFAYQSSRMAVDNGYRVGSKLDWKAHALLCRLFGNQGYYSTLPTRKFLRYIDRIHPDVVHLHNLHSNFINLNMLLRYLGERDIPTVITMHDCWYFTGKCFHYVDVGCDRFTIGCGNCPKRKAPPASLFIDRSASALRDRERLLHAIPRLKIVGCSQWVCDESKKGIMSDLDVVALRNGVDTDIFYPRDRQLLKKAEGLEGKFVIMGMANKWMQPSNAEVIRRVVDSIDDNCTIVIVGCKDEHIVRLKEYGDKVRAVGFISDRNKLAQYYSMADVFVNVTHADTLPTVNMESICCATPVVTYDSCGSPELVLEGCGYTVKEGDIGGIVEKLRLVRDQDFSGLAEKGKKNFNKDLCYKGYIDIYRQLTEPSMEED